MTGPARSCRNRNRVEGGSEAKNPFKFLDAYEKGDREIFFGRDAEIEEILARLYRSRVLVVLVSCGIRHELDQNDQPTRRDTLAVGRARLGAARAGRLW
ncbi:MAG: hypothetical protein HY744_34730 [Deltaproteobacteria bacterium]|nr:hypothetical protein [Deltaproteobacteria bacterium]